MAHQVTQKSILLIGAGAIGTTIATWIAPHHNHFYVMDRGDNLNTIKQNGVFSYLKNHKEEGEKVRVKMIDSFTEIPTPDIILICVKNYSLEGVSSAIVQAYGQRCVDHTIIVGLQNGIENQQILPRYFNKSIYGIISFNAWLDQPGVAGYQAKGPFIFGTPDNRFQTEVTEIITLFNLGVEALASNRFQDAAMSKMIVNLSNSFTTLMGLGYQVIDDKSLFQHILSQLIYEGVQIAKASGHKESKVGNTPSWRLMAASATLPQCFTRRLFDKNVKKMVISSMAQDIIQNGRRDNELESINGHFITIANKHRIPAPYNRAIYQLCLKAFNDTHFSPMAVSDIHKHIKQLNHETLNLA
jgi:2-dehydropantoate 2-reductase